MTSTTNEYLRSTSLSHLYNTSLSYIDTKPSSVSITLMRTTLHLLAAATKKPPPPSFEHFIQRTRALHLYRTILRSLYRIPASSRSEPIAYARGEFQRNRNVADLTQIRYLISTGKAEFESMSRYVDEMAARGKENEG